ncbi:MAG: hypothetical protein IOC38_27325, partial [Burkholderia sp.]|uniref:hypothetical protein n=1 Tax=Burkholderia sp. TaxID=36773 RepID=UPI00258F4833
MAGFADVASGNDAEGTRIAALSPVRPGAAIRQIDQFATGALAPEGADDATGLAAAGDALDGADAGADAADEGAGVADADAGVAAADGAAGPEAEAGAEAAAAAGA